MAGHVVTGRPWWGREVTQGKVLYIVAEGASGMYQRLHAWELGNQTRVGAGRLTFLPVAVQVLNSTDLAAVRRIVTDLGPVHRGHRLAPPGVPQHGARRPPRCPRRGEHARLHRVGGRGHLQHQGQEGQPAGVGVVREAEGRADFDPHLRDPDGRWRLGVVVPTRQWDYRRSRPRPRWPSSLPCGTSLGLLAHRAACSSRPPRFPGPRSFAA